MCFCGHTDHISDTYDEDFAAPAPVTEYVTPVLADTYTEVSPVIEHVTPAAVDVYTAPARVIEHVAPSPVIDYIAPPSAANGVFPNLDTTGFVYPQFSIFAVEAWLFSCLARVRFARVHPSPSGTDRCRARFF